MLALKERHVLSLIIIFLIYAAAIVIGFVVFISLPDLKFITAIFAADIAATIFVWLMGLLLKNSSVYDPYWSVAPIVMAPLAAVYLKIWNVGVILLLGVILLWGIRLTANWAYTFKNLNVQDWRYTQLKDAHPNLWFIINLFGIHLFPTAVVFLIMMPAFIFIMNYTLLNAGIVLSVCLCVFAVALQTISDAQMHSFRKSAANAGLINQTGLWKYIRHPNYLGEILMWWGVYLMLLFTRPDLWLDLIGPLANTLMFIVISIPLMENRQLNNKPDYLEYKEYTGMLLPKHF